MLAAPQWTPHRDPEATMPTHAAPAIPISSSRPFQALWKAVEKPHAALDDELAWMKSMPSSAAYADVLLGIYGFQQACQDGLATIDWSQYKLDLAANSRLVELEMDLSDLGVPVDRRDALPACPIKPPVDRAEASGLLFVVEGSRAGARTIQRWVANALPDAPLRYLEAGTHLLNWQRLNTILTTELNTDEQIQQASVAAVDALEVCRVWLADFGPADKPASAGPAAPCLTTD